MFDKIFWKDAFERAIKTVAQVLLGLLTADGLFNVLNASPKAVAVTALSGAIYSILFSITTAGIRNAGTASLVVNPPTATPDPTASDGPEHGK